MPFTPFHLGPAILMYSLLRGRFELIVTILSNIIIDVEPFLVILLRLNMPLHGPIHSFLGATLLAVLTSGLANYLLPYLYRFIRLKYTYRYSQLLVASLTGTYCHILLDAPLYSEMKPFYPLSGNPLLYIIEPGYIYGGCIFSFLVGFAVWGIWKLKQHI